MLSFQNSQELTSVSSWVFQVSCPAQSAGLVLRVTTPGGVAPGGPSRGLGMDVGLLRMDIGHGCRAWTASLHGSILWVKPYILKETSSCKGHAWVLFSFVAQTMAHDFLPGTAHQESLHATPEAGTGGATAE